MSLPCGKCDRQFSLKSNLTRHLRMVHNIEIQRNDILPADFDVYHYKCLQGCNISFKYNRELRRHLRDSHAIDLAEMILEFPNSEEFKKWLHEEETTNCVQYVHLTATKKKCTGVETFYYECSRTGKRQALDDNIRKRKPRKHGTSKLNRGCTSQIIVNKSHDGSYSVNYFKTHYGHDNDIEHIKLSKQDRGAIASKLLLGMPVSSVLNSVQNSSHGNLKRINLLQRKDVFNIRKSFNIPIKDGKLINVDTINISSFLNECCQATHNPILYHTVNESDEICFIIMNKYQLEMLGQAGNNTILINSINLANCDFILITLFILNNSDSFPAACMFTNKNDYSSYELFFHKIKGKVGQISPEVFISNCDEMYYEAWKNIMGEVTHSIYNPLHIDLDWKLNLNRITCCEAEVTKIKRKWVYDTLKILQAISEESEFLENLEETIKLLDDDVDFKDFLQYFLKNFSDSRRWANYYQTICCIEQLNEINDVLKHYLNEENEIRFDKIFHNFIRFLRDETVNAMVKNDSDRSLFVTENDTRHQWMMEKQFNVSHISEELWNVFHGDTIYIVQRHLTKKCCNLTCSTCNICIHYFSCTCVDFFINNVICDHIHYIWVTYLQSLQVESEEEREREEQVDEEIIIEVDNGQNEQVILDESVNDLKSEIFKRTAVLKANVSNIQNEHALKVVLDTLNQLCDFCTDTNSQVVSEELQDNSIENCLNDHSYI